MRQTWHQAGDHTAHPGNWNVEADWLSRPHAFPRNLMHGSYLNPPGIAPALWGSCCEGMVSKSRSPFSARGVGEGVSDRAKHGALDDMVRCRPRGLRENRNPSSFSVPVFSRRSYFVGAVDTRASPPRGWGCPRVDTLAASRSSGSMEVPCRLWRPQWTDR